MSGSDASTGCQGRSIRRPVPGSYCRDIGRGSYYSAEPHSNLPAHFSRLLRLLRRKGKSLEDAEDLVQEALLHLHVYAKSNAVMNEEAFLRRAVHNLAIDQYRRDRFGLRQEVSIEDVNRENPLIEPSPTPDQVLDNQQHLDELTALLDAMSLRTREIFFAHRSGYTYAEIADRMGIAKITIRRHITRALAALRAVDDWILNDSVNR